MKISNKKLVKKGAVLAITDFSFKKQAAVSEHSQTRTETIFDAVIAIAMTMIALEIGMPEGSSFDAQSLKALFGEITIYFISFIVLASIWGIHARIYSRHTSLGNIQDILLNILLMFLITIFPILTKLMAEMQPSALLNAMYLSCYALMICLTLFLQRLASRASHHQQMDELRKTMGILHLIKDKIQDEKYAQIQQKMELAEQYEDDPATFDLLYQEFIATLPEHIQRKINRQRQTQRRQSIKIIVFYSITFAAISLSVLSMTVNPYFCYPILFAAMILFGISQILMVRRERRFAHR